MICFLFRRSRRTTKQAKSIERNTANVAPATLTRETPTGLKSSIGDDFTGVSSTGVGSTGVGSTGAGSTGVNSIGAGSMDTGSADEEGASPSTCENRSLPLR